LSEDARVTLEPAMEYAYEMYEHLRVAWLPELNGGGTAFGRQYVLVARKRIGKVDRACEMCAGPGFIGFSLLAHGLCDSLCLCDVNPAAIDAIEHTIRINGLQDRVSVYLSDALEGIPEQEQWDLVVGNPPHFMGPQTAAGALLSNDPEWSVHRRFYATVRAHLKPHGQCVIQENYRGSSEETFLPMLDGTGMEYAGSFMVADGVGAESLLNAMYFFCTRARHEELVSVNVPPVQEIALRRDDAGCAIVANRPDAQLLILPLKQKYVFTAPDASSGVAVELRSTDPPIVIQTTLPYTSAESEPISPRRVIAIPTMPCQIADPQSGHELIRFE
jgi:hypothetical protein